MILVGLSQWVRETPLPIYAVESLLLEFLVLQCAASSAWTVSAKTPQQGVFPGPYSYCHTAFFHDITLSHDRQNGSQTANLLRHMSISAPWLEVLISWFRLFCPAKWWWTRLTALWPLAFQQYLGLVQNITISSLSVGIDPSAYWTMCDNHNGRYGALKKKKVSLAILWFNALALLFLDWMMKIMMYLVSWTR